MTPEEQELYDHAKSSLPRWLFQITAAEEWVKSFARIMALARQYADYWISFSRILGATDVWLDQHARDRGTFRQGGETDEILRDRLRTFEDVVNPAAVLSAVQRVLTFYGISVVGYPALVETKRDGAFFGTFTSTGRARAYLSRGYRMRSIRGSIVAILPYAAPEDARRSAFEAVRKKKAGGFKHVVERRQVP